MSVAGACYPDNSFYTIDKCAEFIASRKFVTRVSDEEANFPIAFTIIFYKNLCQFERLLAAIFRPHNPVCVNIDARAPNARKILYGVQSIIKCLHRFNYTNVFLASRLVDIEWARFSSLEADVVCMRDLVARQRAYPFKYLLNLNAHEFPLKTNLEMVRLLRRLDGANVVEGYPIPDYIIRDRFAWEATDRFSKEAGLKLLKGHPQVIVCRGFVEALVSDPRATVPRLAQSESCGGAGRDVLRYAQPQRASDANAGRVHAHRPEAAPV